MATRKIKQYYNSLKSVAVQDQGSANTGPSTTVPTPTTELRNQDVPTAIPSTSTPQQVQQLIFQFNEQMMNNPFMMFTQALMQSMQAMNMQIPQDDQVRHVASAAQTPSTQ